MRLPTGVAGKGQYASFDANDAPGTRALCWAQNGATRSPCRMPGNWRRIGLCADHEAEMLPDLGVDIDAVSL